MFLKLFVNLSVVQPRPKHVILLNKNGVSCVYIGINFSSETEIAQATFMRFQSTRCCWKWSSMKDLPSVTILTLSLLMSYIYIYMYMELLVKPEILMSFIYGPTFGNAESRLFVFAAQCFNTEPLQSAFLCHICV